MLTAPAAMPRRAATTAVWRALGMLTAPMGSASLEGGACLSAGQGKDVSPTSGAPPATAMLISVHKLHF